MMLAVQDAGVPFSWFRPAPFFRFSLMLAWSGGMRNGGKLCGGLWPLHGYD